MPIYKIQGKKDKYSKQGYRVVVNYRDDVTGAPKRVERIVYGKTEARNAERELETKSQKGINDNLSIGVLFNLYCEYQRMRLRVSSYYKMVSVLSNHVLPYFQDVKLYSLNRPRLEYWMQIVSDKGLALNTRRNIYIYFNGMLNYAEDNDYIERNPLKRIGNWHDTGDKERRPMQFYTFKEAKQYLAAAYEYCDRMAAKKGLREWDYYVFFCLAVYTGMRKGEITSLRWSDISKGYISVRRSLNQKAGYLYTAPKSFSSNRKIRMPKVLINVLKEHKKRWSVYHGFNEGFSVCGGYKPLCDSTIENRNKAFCMEAGLKHIRIHDFRHTHASILVNKGINIQEVARRLGHTKVETTWNTYSHMYKEEERKVINVLDSEL